MKILNAMLASGMVIALAGCATSSQVQEMIEASQNDFLKKSAENASSIRVLKQTAKVSIEKDSEHAATMLELKQQQAEATAVLKSLQAAVDAAKLMSASSVVTMSEMKETFGGNKATMDAHIERMQAIDDLYEKVMLAHFQQIADSANAAMASLEADNKPDEADALIQRTPISLDEPIEIIPPDTSGPTNVAPSE
jgi:hypothetical protein